MRNASHPAAGNTAGNTNKTVAQAGTTQVDTTRGETRSAIHGTTRSTVRPRHTPRRTVLAALICVGAGFYGSTAAAQACTEDPADNRLGQMALRVDNDFLGGYSQDQGYTSGVILNYTTPTFRRSDGGCLSGFEKALDQGIGGRIAEDSLQNTTWWLTHGLYTPKDLTRQDLDPQDRPYAGVVMAGMFYNVRNNDRLHRFGLAAGMVGPSALGEPVQNGTHTLIGTGTAEGWDNQLHDEPVLQAYYVHVRKLTPRRMLGRWQHETVGHWGGALGNFSTYLNGGFEWRIGSYLPDDFGSLTFAGNDIGTTPTLTTPPAGWNMHFFVGLDGRFVAHDITLDGNSFRDSHGVDKRPFVGDVGYGFVVTHGLWSFKLARYHRSREFDGQEETPVYGNFTASYKF
ncbi:lipid A deacylase LpxR family protein [Uliginosibacterium sp. H1]|uniref:lipid A deacylase LpxR family protein n=1 Tax=Uliginosibacterium sp. H1 TaxID=3114757 RepID=UPI002E17545E|nr:lipid A deacylase LpxR family protein [Uliginosibacterium sp. H1]